MYFPIGRWLGWVATDQKAVLEGQIEFRDKLLMLDSMAAAVWTNLDPQLSDSCTIQNATEIINLHADKLAERGLEPTNDAGYHILKSLIEDDGIIIHANSSEELFELLKKYVFARNGFPHFDNDIMTNTQEYKPIIVVGFEQLPVSDIQLAIWRNANGRKTLEQIYNEDFSAISLSTFMTDVYYLKTEHLINAI